MSRSRTERLVNLVICLLSTRRFLTAAQIAATVPGYEHDPDDVREHDAFQRKFERDKAELREMGVPLETGRTSAFDTEDGYRIARADYELPEIQLSGEEAAAVGLALRLWESAQLAGAAHSSNAEGSDPSAGEKVDLVWREHVNQALAVLHTMREPDATMAAAGDAQVWQRMVEAALAAEEQAEPAARG